MPGRGGLGAWALAQGILFWLGSGGLGSEFAEVRASRTFAKYDRALVDPGRYRGRRLVSAGVPSSGEGGEDADGQTIPPEPRRELSRRLQTAPEPTPAQTYFVPLPEGDMAFAFSGIAGVDMSSTPMYTLTSVAVAIAGTVIWYDHWEDGYEDDVTSPRQSSTQIWGDGDFGNGCVERILKRMENPPVYDYTCTASDADYITGAMALILQEENAIALPRDANNIYFDGGDLVQSSFPVGMTRGGYPSSPGTVLGGACEVFESAKYGKLFYAPVGQDTETQDDSFTLTEMYVMAFEDDTEIKYDGNVVATIDRGETHVQLSVNAGLVLEATKDIQVIFITGDFDSAYETRWYNLLPFEEWSSDYYTPINSDASAKAVVWIYNPPGNGQIILYKETNTGSLNFNIPDGSPDPTGFNGWIPLDSAATGTRFYTGGGEPFFMMLVMDVPNGSILNLGHAYDWGHPLLPAEMLSSRAVVGWGPGCVDNDCGGGINNNMIYVTPVAAANVYVDYNGDGTIDSTTPVGKLDQLIIEDTGDNDMTGAVISADDAATGAAVEISVVWGLNPSLSSLFDDSEYDLGAAVVPISRFATGAIITLQQDYGTLQLDTISPGDTMKVTIRLAYLGIIELAPGAVSITADFSPIFDQADYVAGSTEYFDELGNTVSISDDTMPQTTFPLDGNGVLTQFPLKDATAHQVTFLVTIKEMAALTSDLIQVRGHVSSSPIVPFYAQNIVRFLPKLELVVTAYRGHDGGASCQSAYEDALVKPGNNRLVLVHLNARVTYCYVVTNTGNSYFDHSVGVTLNDAFASNWGDLGGPSMTAPGESVTLVVEKNAGGISGDAVANVATVGGTATLHNGYTVAAPSLSDPDTITVESVDFGISELIHCESFSHEVIMKTDIMHFEFVAHSTGCVNVRIFINDRARTQQEKDDGRLASSWDVICHANIQGMGSSTTNLTDIPPEYCTPTTVEGGVTRHFFIAVVEQDEQVCQQAATPSGDNYMTTAAVETDAAGVCVAGN